MDKKMDIKETRIVGNYILGPKAGWGSFAVVWRARHRESGVEVAVKEIDKKQDPKVIENLSKEIHVLSTIHHPNIIRLFECIETTDRIFLVLEYCDGGDLAGYIHRHGRVSEAVARHFMRQLAAGLQVLQEKHLIHRDLKPQNLLLSSREATPQLKIGDFGFARSLTPNDLAHTLCGSPLYMAPEIIQSQKYDAKADLWSVGAILFQLVTGKPPFNGNTQYQLFENILASTELRFPECCLEELHPDCVDLCRSLLRRKPVERLTFQEFFNHKFLGEPRLMGDVELSSLFPRTKSDIEQFVSSASEKAPQLNLEERTHTITRDEKLTSFSVNNDVVVHGKICGSTCRIQGAQCFADQSGVDDSVASIEKDYVIVNRHFTSMGTFSYCLETSLQDNSTATVSVCPPKLYNYDTEAAMETNDCAASSGGAAENSQIHGPDPSCSLTILREVQGLSMLCPSTRIHLLCQYVEAIAHLAQEKYNAGLFMESLSVELVVLAIWKKAHQICCSWMESAMESEFPESSSVNESTDVHIGTHLSPELTDEIDFSKPSSVCKWVEQGFISAIDRAQKFVHHHRDMDAAAEMPEAMEIIFQKALAVGISGAVDENREKKDSAAVAYTKAMLLLSFIVGEATLLPLSPPFLLTPANKKRIESYIIKLQSHQFHFLTLQSGHQQTPDTN